jgi:hypothetical protein
MNHPSPETWVEFLYGELPATAERECRNHLETCPECRARVDSWNATQALLDEDHATLAPRAAAVVAIPTPWFRRPAIAWAAAAAVAIGTGFLAGRWTGPSRAEWHRELARTREELRNELQLQQQEQSRAVATSAVQATSAETQRFLNEFADRIQAARTSDRRDLLQTLQALEERHSGDLGQLRGDVRQLARTTGNGFRQAESQFNLIASQLPAESTAGPLPSASPAPVR